MTNTQTRLDIAAACTTVTGLTGYPKRPLSIKPGDCWPQWGGSDRVQARAFEETWRVLIALPGDEVTADEWADTYQGDLINALSPVLYIDRIEPALIPMSGSDTPAVMITGRTE
jgi:hypothetical protein